MSKPFSSHLAFGVVATGFSFALCATLCAFFIAGDNMTMIDFRRALLREQWFWYAVFVCVLLSYIVRYMWPRLNPPHSAISTGS